MADSDLLERLREHRAVGAAPQAELEWLIAHGERRSLAVGEYLVRKGQFIPTLHIVLAGEIGHFVDHGGGRRKVMSWKGGDVTGMLPYSRMRTSPGDSLVEEPLDALFIDGEHIPAMIRDCQFVTAAMVHTMLDRARVFNANALHDDKMISLGKLAAGLAHELNNPASAATRSAKLLPDALAEADAAALALGALSLTVVQTDTVNRVRELCMTVPRGYVLSPIERADREDMIATWLDNHDGNVDAAAPLAETSVTLGTLDSLAKVLDGDALNVALRWLSAGCTARSLAMDVERASGRVYDLVSSVKRFTYMDHATVPEPVDVSIGLTDTIAVLTAKARGKSVAVSVHVEPGLPPIRGFGGELNQIWSNLIDNALDAVPEGGHVEVRAGVQAGFVVVRVIDDGPGIPAEIKSRIFDPFFTTKPVGQGTGLGLDIVAQLVRHHGGEIDVESAPGRTVFTVRLSAAQVAAR